MCVCACVRVCVCACVCIARAYTRACVYQWSCVCVAGWLRVHKTYAIALIVFNLDQSLLVRIGNQLNDS